MDVWRRPRVYVGDGVKERRTGDGGEGLVGEVVVVAAAAAALYDRKT